MNSIKTLFKAISMAYQCDGPAFVRKVVYVLFQSLLPLANLYVLKLMVDEISELVVVQHEGGIIDGFNTWIFFLWASLFCGIFFLNRLIGSLNSVNSDILSQKLVDFLSDKLQHQAVSLDMAYYDNPQYHDTFHRAQQEASYRPIQILNNFMSVVGALISIIGVICLLVSASWWVIAVMLVAIVPSFFVRMRKARKIYAFRRENTQDFRRSNYYSTILTHRDFAKELRAYGLACFFRERFVTTRQRLASNLVDISRRVAMFDVLCAVVEVLALAFVLKMLVGGTIGGALTVGSFVMLFEAFRRGQGYLSSLVAGLVGLYDNRLFVGNLFEFMELKPNILSPTQPVPMPKHIESVEFCNVTFRYPDMDHDVLSHYNMKATLGEITLIEGENGYGKSTMLKLLLRLYDVDEGDILINGINLRQFDVSELRHSIGVIFQDYVRYFCTVEENVRFGDISIVDADECRLNDALAISGANSVVDKLPQGLKTPLGRMFDGGSELSMGQWQRIALARQLYSQAPILVFDEPTAWMDTQTRQHFNESLGQLKDNHLIILIKHK